MKKTVALDVDGVLADYTKGWQGIDIIGDPIDGAVEFSKQLSEIASVLIYTTRCTEELNKLSPQFLHNIIKKWLDQHGFHYDEIYTGQGKPIVGAIIDDRAVLCRPQDEKEPQQAYAKSITDLRKLLKLPATNN